MHVINDTNTAAKHAALHSYVKMKHCYISIFVFRVFLNTLILFLHCVASLRIKLRKN